MKRGDEFLFYFSFIKDRFLLIQYSPIPLFLTIPSHLFPHLDLFSLCLSLEEKVLLRCNKKHNEIKYNKVKQKPLYQCWTSQTNRKIKDLQENAQESKTHSFIHSEVS